MVRFTAAFLLSLTVSLVPTENVVQGTGLVRARLLDTLSTSDENSNTTDPSINDDPSIDDEDADDDFSPWVFGEEGCDEHWPQTKLDYETNMREHWSNPSCYLYEFQYIVFGPPELLRPIRISVVDGVVDHVEDVEDPSNVTPSPYIPQLTMNDIFDEIQKKCFQDCPEKGAPECSVHYDALHGNVKDLMINDSLVISDMVYMLQITNFQPCVT
jgi:Family of unknown function (DUF6174)